jgi:O-antigen ligase
MINSKTRSNIIKENVFIILLRVIVLVLLGSLFISVSSLVIKGFAGIGIVFIFSGTLFKGDFFSALMQLFICNHFAFASEYGGIYNWLFASSLIIFFIVGKRKEIHLKSSFNSIVKFCLAGLIVIQLLSVIGGNDFATSKKIIAILSFLIVASLFYFSSSIKLDNYDYSRFLIVICIFFIYMFIASLNQRLLFITSNYPFFPRYDDTTKFELDITRSRGTFQNYEAYAEYSLLIIALLLPGVLSGSFKRIDTKLYILCLFTIFLGVFSIVLSATRSSILLLPVLIFIILYNSKKIKANSLLLIGFLIGLFLIGNSFFKIVDFSVFSKRSEDMNVNSLSLSKVFSGEQINRGPLFSLGIKKIKRNGGLIGGGYFTSPEEYQAVHFGNDYSEYDDYHNLYLSIIVMWGFIGALLFISIILSLHFKGVRLYRRVKRNSSLPNDLLLGFNTMFILFLINEFKIQFNRQVNYFTLILILLAIYSSLIRQISQPRFGDINN